MITFFILYHNQVAKANIQARGRRTVSFRLFPPYSERNPSAKRIQLAINLMVVAQAIIKCNTTSVSKHHLNRFPPAKSHNV